MLAANHRASSMLHLLVNRELDRAVSDSEGGGGEASPQPFKSTRPVDVLHPGPQSSVSIRVISAAFQHACFDDPNWVRAGAGEKACPMIISMRRSVWDRYF